MHLGLLLQVRPHLLLEALVLVHVGLLLTQGRVGPLQPDSVGVDGACICRGLLWLGVFHHLGLVVDTGSHVSDHFAVVEQLLHRRGLGLSHQLLLPALVHLGVEEHQLLPLFGRYCRDLLRQQHLQVVPQVEARDGPIGELITALDSSPVAILSEFLLLIIGNECVAIAAVAAGGPVDEPAQGALPRLRLLDFVAVVALHILVVCDPDSVGDDPFLPVDLGDIGANAVNGEDDLIRTYMFVEVVLIINKLDSTNQRMDVGNIEQITAA